jgi:hypothetical protein
VNSGTQSEFRSDCCLEQQRKNSDCVPEFTVACRYNSRFTAAYATAMEADRLNTLQNTLQDLAARSVELRRYL